MGQVTSVATPHANVLPFVNLPKEAILSIWLSYNLLGEGWALTLDQFASIFKEANFVQSHYNFSDDQISKLFVTLDTDANGLIDALETFVTIGLLSGMDALDKLSFAFSAFDLEGKGGLSRDETNLVFRSLMKGIQKTNPTTPGFEATQDDAAKFSDLLFASAPLGRVYYDDFQSYCTTHPVISSWLKSVAAFDSHDRVSDAGVKDPAARSEWIAALDAIFAKNGGNRRAAHHTITHEDILLNIEQEAAQNAGGEGEGEEGSGAEAAPELWIEKVRLLKPEETPGPQRSIMPEDVIDPVWMSGINARRVVRKEQLRSFVEDRIHRSVRYRTAENDGILFASGSSIVAMKKNEETGQWSQELGNAHNSAISCFDVHYEKDLLVTAEGSVDGEGKSSPQLVVWKLSTLTVRKRINCPHGVKFLDLNANGSLALVVYEDPLSNIVVLNLDSGAVMYSKQLLLNNALGDRVTDARFCGSSSMFVVTSTKLGVRFFVNEETSLMGKENMQLYDERPPLFGTLGKDLRDASFLCACRLDASDEIACGTEAGQIVVWRGRTAAQVLEAHRGPVLALDFHLASKMLASGGEDGTVKLFEVVTSSHSSSPKKKGPQPLPTRSLQCTATFDILRHPLLSYGIGALSLSKDASKLLICTASRDLLEVRCRILPPTPEELEEAAAAGGGTEEEEGAIPAAKGQLGDDLQGGPILSTHFLSSESLAEGLSMVTCACRLPSGGFVTCGSDRSVRIWQLVGDGETGNAYKPVKSVVLDCPASAVAATAASSIVVALSSTTSPRSGTLQILALPDGTVSSEIVDCKQTTRFLLASADGNLIVAIGEEGKAVVFALAEGAWTTKGNFSLAGLPISADLSADAQFFRCFYADTRDVEVYDIGANFGKELFTSIRELMTNAPKAPVTVGEDGEEIEDAAAPVNPAAGIIEALRNVQWATQSCPFAFDTTGAKVLHGSSSKLFDRSNAMLLGALGDGSVSICRLPLYKAVKRIPSRTFAAHVGPLSTLLFFEEGGSKLLTIGDLDGVVRVWKVAYDTEEPEVDLPDPVPEDGEQAPPPAEEGEEGAAAALPKLYDSGEEDDLLDAAEMKKHLVLTVREEKQRGEGEEFALISAQLPAVLDPYAKSLGFPNTIELVQAAGRMYHTEITPVPTDEIKLQWVYGCSSRQTRSAVRYTAEGAIAYPAGTVAVVLDKVAKKQKHVHPHKDEITCLDVHLGRKIAATAHKGVGSITAFIWKTLNGQVLRTLDCGVCNGVSAIKFSPDGAYLAVACQDAEHTVKVFSTEDGTLLASIAGGDKKILCLAFSELPVTPGPTWRILQGGVKHFRVLSFNTATRSLTHKTGMYGADVRKSHVNCVTSLPLTVGEDGVASGNEFVLGMSDGTLAFLPRGENRVAGFTPCLTGPVNAICTAKTKEATAEEPAVIRIIAAGTNGAMKVLDMDLQPVSEWNLYAKADHGLYDLGRVRGFKSVCMDKLNRKILFSTAAGEIGEIDLATGDDLNGAPVVCGHFRDRLRSLAAHPIRQECLSAGEDKTLRVWDLEQHSIIAMIELPAAAVCAAFAPNGHIIVVGLARKPEEQGGGGQMAIVSYLQGKLRIVHVTGEPKDEIASVAFSPDGSKVFAASLDHTIYVYDALNNFIVVTTLTGHQQGVKLLDVSQNGRYLISQSVTNEVMAWDLNSFSAISRPRDRFEVLAEVESHWSTRQTLFSPNSLGIFEKNVHPEEILTVGQSKDAKLLAVGGQNGLLRLLSCPSTKCYAPYKNFALHSAGGLGSLAFTVEDHYLLTAGLHDKMVAQWRVVKNKIPVDLPAETGTAARDEEPAVEETFNASFVVKGVDFRTGETDNIQSFADGFAAQLTHVLGVGNSARWRSLPTAQFCGSGEVATVLGKAIVTLEDDGKKLRVWNFNTVQDVNHSDATQSSPRSNISCIAASASGRFVLVGTDDDSASLVLYHAPSGRVCLQLSTTIQGGVVAAGMAMNDQVVACLGGDAHHSLYVFKTFSGDWDDALLLYSGHVSDAPISLLAFSNTTASIGQEYASTDFVTAGVGRIRFWRIEGLNVLSLPGNYASEEPCEVTALARGGAAQITVTGDTKGRVIAWEGNYANVLDTLSSPVTAMTAFGQSSSGGSKTGIVLATNTELVGMDFRDLSWTTAWRLSLHDVVRQMDWASELYLSGFNGRELSVCAMASDPACRQVLLSLANGALLSLSTDSLSVRRVLEGHSSRAGVCQVLSLPTDPNILLTFCEDGVVRMWDVSETAVIAGVTLSSSSSSSTAESPRKSSTRSTGGNGGGSGPTLLGYSLLAHTPTAATFLNDHTLAVAVRDADESSSSASIFLVRVGWKFPARRPELVIVHRLHNIGRGPIRQLRLSPAGKYLSACSSDGCVYVFEMSPVSEDGGGGGGGGGGDGVAGVGVLSPLGFLLAHPSGAPVTAVDFSQDNRYARTFGENMARFNGKVEVNFFDFELTAAANATATAGAAPAAAENKLRRHAAGKIQDVGQLEAMKATVWATVGASAAPEVRGLSYPADTADQSRPMPIHSVETSADNQLVCAGYDDGSVRVFRYPAFSKFKAGMPKASLTLDVHSPGPVLTTFVRSSQPNAYRLVTVGQSDGCVTVWTLA